MYFWVILIWNVEVYDYCIYFIDKFVKIFGFWNFKVWLWLILLEFYGFLLVFVDGILGILIVFNMYFFYRMWIFMLWKYME